MENNSNKPDISFGGNERNDRTPIRRSAQNASGRRPARPAPGRPLSGQPVGWQGASAKAGEPSPEAIERINRHKAMIDQAIDDMDKPAPPKSKEEVYAGAAKAARQAASKQEQRPLAAIAEPSETFDDGIPEGRSVSRRPDPSRKNRKRAI